MSLPYPIRKASLARTLRCGFAISAMLVSTTSTRAEITRDDVISCLVLPWESISLAAAAEGVVKVINVDRGDTVEAGQVLVQLDDRMQASYQELMRARAEDHSGIELAEIRLDIAASSHERNRALFERQQITGDEWDRIRGTFETAQIELEQARQAVAQAELELARAQAAYEQTQIVAPTDAVVLQRNVSVGEAPSGKPLLELAVIDRLRIELFARARTYRLWAQGQDVSLNVDLPEPQVIDARIRAVNPVSDAGTDVIGILLELDNSRGDVLPGQACRLASVPSGSGAGHD